MFPNHISVVKTRPETTLIITTYNQPQFLELSLRTVFEQTILPDEVIVASDGSTDETLEVVRKFVKEAPVPIKYFWQPDIKNRLNRSRNNGLAGASGDYVVLIDGDCFLERRFIADHLACAKVGRFITGTRLHLNARRRDHILTTGDCKLRLWSFGMSKRLHLLRSRLLSRLFSEQGDRVKDVEKITDREFTGANCSFWRADALKINGFNEYYLGWGGNDHEFALRLCRAGVSRFRMRHYGVLRHFQHGARAKGDRSDEFFKKLPLTLEDGIRCRPEYGLNRALEELKTLQPIDGFYWKFS